MCRPWSLVQEVKKAVLESAQRYEEFKVECRKREAREAQEAQQQLAQAAAAGEGDAAGASAGGQPAPPHPVPRTPAAFSAVAACSGGVPRWAVVPATGTISEIEAVAKKRTALWGKHDAAVEQRRCKKLAGGFVYPSPDRRARMNPPAAAAAAAASGPQRADTKSAKLLRPGAGAVTTMSSCVDRFRLSLTEEGSDERHMFAQALAEVEAEVQSKDPKVIAQKTRIEYNTKVRHSRCCSCAPLVPLLSCAEPRIITGKLRQPVSSAIKASADANLVRAGD